MLSRFLLKSQQVVSSEAIKLADGNCVSLCRRVETFSTVGRVVDDAEYVSDSFGGPCRGLHYGLLIKRDKRPVFRRVLCCEGFPTFV